MNTKSQCQRIVKAFGKRWFSSMIAFEHLKITSIHRRLTDLRNMGYVIEKKWHPSGEFKVYRIVSKAA